MKKEIRLGIIGLGYVGLPLAVVFGNKIETMGYDINEKRVEDLKKGIDKTHEVSSEKMRQSEFLRFTSDIFNLIKCNYYIVAVPTPIDKFKRPDLKPLLSASRDLGKIINKNDIIIYESTVYPGCTEEECVPILEKESGLKYNIDFFCGYSPERINPGDKLHTVDKIKKVTSGSTIETAEKVDSLYKIVIEAGTYLAPSIMVAEAAKVIENAQRDINIAFVNELSILFKLLNIDTLDVLKAAKTKWNFLPFTPGLVGGHCIGVDPYYLAHKAQKVGYHPEILLAGRRLNDNMGNFVAQEVIKLMAKKGHRIYGANVLVLGITFKENCPDTRNTRSIDVINELNEYGCKVVIHDPWADPEEVKKEYGIKLLENINGIYDAIVLTVAHEEFKKLDYIKLTKKNTVIFDVKGIIPKEMLSGRL